LGYKRKHTEEDRPSIVHPFWNIIFVDKDGKIPYVMFLNYKEKYADFDKKDIICFARIGYDLNKEKITTGLIEMRIIHQSEYQVRLPDFVQKEIRYAEIYTCIRDIYHRPTHHDDSHELLCAPVKASDRNEAIKKILEGYNEKIIKYHKTIKEYYKGVFKGDIEKSINNILHAKGEMIYAQRLIELVKVNDFYDSKNAFSHTYNSFEDFDEHITTMHESKRSEEMATLTGLMCILTIAMIIFMAFSLGYQVL